VRTQPLRDALGALARVYEQEHVTRSFRIDALPLPDLDLLRQMGMATVTEEEFAAAVEAAEKTRRALYGALLYDGWTWDDAIRIPPPAR
jgi:hypothetical protein